MPPLADAAATEPTKDVEVQSGSEDSDDDLPPLENAEGGVPAGAEGEKHASRLEKKARKALLKMGLTPQPGFSRVTMRKAPNILFVIPTPEVYRATGTDTWVVFGDYKIEDMQAQAQAQYAQQMRRMQDMASAAAAEGTKEVEAPSNEAAGEEEGADESGLDAKDVELVMGQASVSRQKAVAALRKSNGDVVNAIMELTM